MFTWRFQFENALRLYSHCHRMCHLKQIKVNPYNFQPVFNDAETPYVLNEHVARSSFILCTYVVFFLTHGKTNFPKTNIDISCVNDLRNHGRKYHQLSTFFYFIYFSAQFSGGFNGSECSDTYWKRIILSPKCDSVWKTYNHLYFDLIK